MVVTRLQHQPLYVYNCYLYKILVSANVFVFLPLYNYLCELLCSIDIIFMGVFSFDITIIRFRKTYGVLDVNFISVFVEK
jgi:hypothetical protein